MTIRKHWCIFLSAANKRSKLIGALASFLLFSGASIAQELLPSLSTEISQKNASSYQVGDRIQLNVRIPLELAQELTAVQLKNPDDKNTLDKLGWYLDPSPQIINGNLRFIVAPIKSGKLIMPELQIMNSDSRPLAKTTAVSVEVAEMANPTAPPGLLETITISLPLRVVFLGIFILLTLTLAAYLIYKRYFKNKIVSKPIKEIKLPPTPDHVIALRDLSALFEQHPYSRENLKPVAFGVSQILKNFFSARFKVDARESTTDEMLRLLREESLPAADIKRISSLFQNLDLVKFTEPHYYQHLHRADYLEFRDQAKSMIEDWAAKGDQT